MQVRELSVVYGKSVADVDGRRALCPADAARVFTEFLGDEPQEVFAAILLDSRSRVIGVQEITRGTVTASLVHPREVFKAAIMLNAVSIIVAHNHPSSDTEPSREDHTVTRRLRSAGNILGIPLRDHVIVAHGAKPYSFAASEDF